VKNKNKVVEAGKKASQIFILPINKNWLIYAPLINVTAFVNNEAVSTIKDFILNGKKSKITDNSLSQLIQQLKETNKIIPGKIKGQLSPEIPCNIFSQEFKKSRQFCNFNIVTKSKKQMNYEALADAIDWYACNIKSLKKDALNVHFYANNLISFPEIFEVALHRIKYMASIENLRTNFEISIGSQIEEKWLDFIGDYFKKVFLSIDIKDLNQIISSDKSLTKTLESAKALANSNAQLFLKIRNTEANEMKQIASWMCENINPDAICFEYNTQHSVSKNSKLSKSDEFSKNFLESRKIIESYGIKTLYSEDIKEYPVLTCCPDGQDTLIVYPYGCFYGYHLISKSGIKKASNLNIGQTKKINKNEIINLGKEAIINFRCETCFCRWSCAGGCYVEDEHPVFSNNYNNHCIQTRIISACSLLTNLELGSEIDMLMAYEHSLNALKMQHSDLLENFETR